MNPDVLIAFVTSLSVFDFVKWAFVLGLLVYMVFAVIIVKQVGIMNEALEDPRNPIVAFLGWAHLLLTILLIIVSIVIL